jgi:hypothetical protein
MWLDSWLRPDILWWGAAGITAAYLALFVLTRRPVGLRLSRLGWLALCVFGMRLAMLILGCALATYEGAGLTIVVLLGALGLCSSDHVWLARAEAEELRQQVRTACRALFLTWAEPEPGRFLLTSKSGTFELRTRPLSRRIQVVVIPRLFGRDKVTLLVHWLRKQYPGPVPRVRIVLKRSES